jgi:hypothetical protein
MRNLLGTSPVDGTFGYIEARRRTVMKAILIAAALAFGATTVATVPGNAASVGVTITTRDDNRWDNGRHYGWWKGKRAWRNRDCEVYRTANGS